MGKSWKRRGLKFIFSENSAVLGQACLPHASPWDVSGAMQAFHLCLDPCWVWRPVAIAGGVLGGQGEGFWSARAAESPSQWGRAMGLLVSWGSKLLVRVLWSHRTSPTKKTKVKVKLLRISRQSIKSHGVGGSSESVPYVTKLAAHQWSRPRPLK